MIIRLLQVLSGFTRKCYRISTVQTANITATKAHIFSLSATSRLCTVWWYLLYLFSVAFFVWHLHLVSTKWHRRNLGKLLLYNYEIYIYIDIDLCVSLLISIRQDSIEFYQYFWKINTKVKLWRWIRYLDPIENQLHLLTEILCRGRRNTSSSDLKTKNKWKGRC